MVARWSAGKKAAVLLRSLGEVWELPAELVTTGHHSHPRWTILGGTCVSAGTASSTPKCTLGQNTPHLGVTRPRPYPIASC